MFELVIVTRQAYQDALMNKGCLRIYGLKCPRIATHLEALGFDVLLVANEWFLGAFSKSLPLEVDQRSPSQTVSSPALSRVESLTSRSGTEQKAGLSCKHPKVFLRGKREESTCLILQQILDLKRLQCSDGSNCSSFMRCQEKPDASLPEDNENWKLHNKLNQQFQVFPRSCLRTAADRQS